MWRPCKRLRRCSAYVAAPSTAAAAALGTPQRHCAETTGKAQYASNSEHHGLAASATLPTATALRRRKLRCLRGAYHASRAVAQLLLPLLQPARSILGYMDMTDAMKNLATALEGSPVSLEHEGPLQDAHLIAIRDLATSATVTDLRSRLLNGSLCPRGATSLTAALWNKTSVRDYQKCLLAARQARLDAGHSFNGYDHLAEAGAAMRSAMCSDVAEPKTCAEWARLIDLYTSFLPDRSHIHELENLPQEIAIGELLRETVERVRRAEDHAGGDGFALDCVVDVGGGNGFLAAQVAERLQCDSVVIDPFFPAHSIDCCPRLWPDTAHRARPATRRQRTLHRTVALFRDVRWSDAVPATPARTALIAKHLCGSGVDEVLRHLEAQESLPRILVLAPCCFSKCSLDTYIDPDFVSALLGLGSAAAFCHLTRLTDWNVSVHQRLQGVALSGRGPSASVSKKSVRYFVSCPEGIAASVEAVVSQGRVQWLQRHGYIVRLVEYVPDCVTPKNRCMVAYRT